MFKKVNEGSSHYVNAKDIRDANYSLKDLSSEKTKLDKKKKLNLEDAFEIFYIKLVFKLN